jgi:hypothetical protein
MSHNYQMINKKEDQIIYNNPKMKFLDDLFEDKVDKSLDSRTISIETKKVEVNVQEIENSILEHKRAAIFSLKIFIGLLLSFFFLSYVFSFRLIMVVPLTLISLFLYLVKMKGHRNYHQYVKSIRRRFHSIIKKIKRRNKQTIKVEKLGMDYILLK